MSTTIALLKRRGLVLLLLLSSTVALLAQQNDQSLQDRYDAIKISILPDGADQTFLNWTVNEGFKRINEPTFLQLTGFQNEAQKSAGHLVLKWGLVSGGMATVLAGFAVMILPLLQTSSTTDTFTPFVVGLGIVTGGSFLSLFTFLIPNDTVPYGRAEQIARDYNQYLLEKLNADTK